jgi:hypothetical protein
MSLYGTNFIPFDTTDLGNIMVNKSSCTLTFPTNATTITKQQIVYPNRVMIKETDIVCQMNGYPQNGNQVVTFGPKIQNIYITGNFPQTSANPMSYSTDGYTFYGLNYTNIFTPNALARGINSIKYNGSIWVACSNNTNTLAYSYDGINWIGLGTAIFSITATCVEWNGKMWVACGSGTNSLAYSYDGINWTGLGTSIITNAALGGQVSWNGFVWLATGQLASSGSGTFAASSPDGINWTSITVASQTASFTGVPYTWCVIWDGIKWIMGGQTGSVNGLWYTYDVTGKTGWIGAGIVFSGGHTYSLYFNGKIYISGGNVGGQLAYSYTGISNWTQVASIGNNQGRTIKWDGKKFIMVFANGSSTNMIAYSMNGVNWVGLGANPDYVASGLEFNSLRPHSITFQRNITIAAGNGTANTRSMKGQRLHLRINARKKR